VLGKMFHIRRQGARARAEQTKGKRRRVTVIGEQTQGKRQRGTVKEVREKEAKGVGGRRGKGGSYILYRHMGGGGGGSRGAKAKAPNLSHKKISKAQVWEGSVQERASAKAK
jgi:hypothetical protein